MLRAWNLGRTRPSSTRRSRRLPSSRRKSTGSSSRSTAASSSGRPTSGSPCSPSSRATTSCCWGPQARRRASRPGALRLPPRGDLLRVPPLEIHPPRRDLRTGEHPGAQGRGLPPPDRRVSATREHRVPGRDLQGQQRDPQQSAHARERTGVPPRQAPRRSAADRHRWCEQRAARRGGRAQHQNRQVQRIVRSRRKSAQSRSNALVLSSRPVTLVLRGHPGLPQPR